MSSDVTGTETGSISIASQLGSNVGDITKVSQDFNSECPSSERRQSFGLIAAEAAHAALPQKTPEEIGATVVRRQSLSKVAAEAAHAALPQKTPEEIGILILLLIIINK